MTLQQMDCLNYGATLLLQEELLRTVPQSAAYSRVARRDRRRPVVPREGSP